MPYDAALADRIRRQLNGRSGLVEKTMFGCVGFLLHGNVCVAVWKDSLVARVGPQAYEAALRESFVREFDITGRAMTGWVRVAPQGLADDDQLADWIDQAARFVRTLPRRAAASPARRRSRGPS